MLAVPVWAESGPEIVFANGNVYLKAVGAHPPERQVALSQADLTVELLRLTNETRRQHGLQPLTVHLSLQMAALSHAQEMRDLQYFSHASPTPGRGTSRQRIQLYGCNPVFVAENIFECSGYDIGLVPRFAAQAFLQSPEHRENLLNPSVTHMGIGLVARDGCVSVSQVFASLKPKLVFE
jgi:uncharacterized protein YkwD